MARAIFLDRDGVINARRHLFVRSWRGFRFESGALDALARLAATDFRILVVTNQPWVSLGWLPERALDELHRRMIAAVQDAGGRIDRVYHCDATRADAPCRKPNPGMLLQGQRDFDLAPSLCWMVGDQARDVEAGRRFGARTALVNPTLRARLAGAARLADVRAPSLAAAVERILA